MAAIVETATDGAKGFDCDTPLGKTHAKQFKALGFDFAVRYLSRLATPPSTDLTKAEVNAILDSGLALMAVQHVAKAGWIPSLALGTQYGANAVKNAKAVDLPAGTTLYLDLEQVSPAVGAADVIAHCNEWYAQVAAGGYLPGIYVGVNCGLTPDQLYQKLKFQYYWKSGSNVPPIPVRGWSMVQTIVPNEMVAGIGIDRDVIKTDAKGMRPAWARSAVAVVAAAPAAATVAAAVAPAPVPANGDDATVLRALASQAGVSPAMERLIQYRDAHLPASHPRHWAVVNFDLHSAKPRMFVFDRVAGSYKSYLCAHGKGSEGPTDNGMADVFSNVPESERSSLGIYRCAEIYHSKKHGEAMRLDGLEATNSNARKRAIVVHGADYVSQKKIDQTGRIGRSEGCPAVEDQYAPEVVNALNNGSLMILWKTGA